MSKISKWVKEREPIRRLSSLFIFILIITYFVFFVFMGGYGNSLTYENAYLSFLSLIISTGFTSIYNLLTRKKRWRPKSIEENELKEKVKDTMNITTVATNILYMLVVYLNNSELGDYLMHISPQLLMSVLAGITSTIAFTVIENSQKKKRWEKFSETLKNLDKLERQLDYLKEIIVDERKKKYNKFNKKHDKVLYKHKR